MFFLKNGLDAQKGNTVNLFQRFCEFAFRGVVHPAPKIVEDFLTAAAAHGQNIRKPESFLVAPVQGLEFFEFLRRTLIELGARLFGGGFGRQVASLRQLAGQPITIKQGLLCAQQALQLLSTWTTTSWSSRRFARQ